MATNKPRSALISAEKEDRYYATRGSACLGLDDNAKMLMDQQVKEDTGIVWPRLFPTLSSKEKEQDFMAMKGCKLPQRPKKRAKLIQRSILVSHTTFYIYIYIKFAKIIRYFSLIIHYCVSLCSW